MNVDWERVIIVAMCVWAGVLAVFFVASVIGLVLAVTA